MTPLSSADAETVDPSVEVAEDVPVDEQRAALVAALADALGDGLVESHVDPGVDVWVRVTAGAWVDAARALRDRCGMAYFDFLSAIDWMPSPFGRDMDAQVDLTDGDDSADEAATGGYETGLAGGETRFQLLARVHDPVGHVGITIKADLAGELPQADS